MPKQPLKRSRADPLAEIRRVRLLKWIKEIFKRPTLQFAQSVKKSQPQIHDMLSGKKSFGSKIARELESRAGMPKYWLDGNSEIPTDAVMEPRQTYHQVLITKSAAMLAAEWEKLDVSDRMEIEADILQRVAKKVREERRKQPPSKPRDKPEAPESE